MRHPYFFAYEHQTIILLMLNIEGNYSRNKDKTLSKFFEGKHSNLTKHGTAKRGSKINPSNTSQKSLYSDKILFKKSPIYLRQTKTYQVQPYSSDKIIPKVRHITKFTPLNLLLRRKRTVPKISHFLRQTRTENSHSIFQREKCAYQKHISDKNVTKIHFLRLTLIENHKIF